ncbi:MAG: hypothetical protein IPK13_07885 [Deltaproteobacteria bacterium]|nr:hypothetical protein [Deltaproteobacteria bacterium]
MLQTPLLLLSLTVVSAAPAPPPSAPLKRLRNFAGECYGLVEPGPDHKLVEEPKNGYLHVEGSYPTCGCGCSVTVGAYRRTSGAHVMLKREEWTCEQAIGLSASVPLSSILPMGVGLATFGAKPPASDEARFFLDVEIPRHGTKTVLLLRMLPFGVRATCAHGLCVDMLDRDNTRRDSLELVWKLVHATSDPAVLEAFMNQGVVSPEWMREVASMLDHHIKTVDDLRKELLALRRTYEIYQSLATTRVTLSWNRVASRFDVANKKAQPSPPPRRTFLEFLKESHFWQPVC